MNAEIAYHEKEGTERRESQLRLLAAFAEDPGVSATALIKSGPMWTVGVKHRGDDRTIYIDCIVDVPVDAVGGGDD